MSTRPNTAPKSDGALSAFSLLSTWSEPLGLRTWISSSACLLCSVGQNSAPIIIIISTSGKLRPKRRAERRTAEAPLGTVGHFRGPRILLGQKKGETALSWAPPQEQSRETVAS